MRLTANAPITQMGIISGIKSVRGRLNNLTQGLIQILEFMMGWFFFILIRLFHCIRGSIYSSLRTMQYLHFTMYEIVKCFVRCSNLGKKVYKVEFRRMYSNQRRQQLTLGTCLLLRSTNETSVRSQQTSFLALMNAETKRNGTK